MISWAPLARPSTSFQWRGNGCSWSGPMGIPAPAGIVAPLVEPIEARQRPGTAGPVDTAYAHSWTRTFVAVDSGSSFPAVAWRNWDCVVLTMSTSSTGTFTSVFGIPPAFTTVTACEFHAGTGGTLFRYSEATVPPCRFGCRQRYIRQLSAARA